MTKEETLAEKFKGILWAPKLAYMFSSGGNSALINFLPIFCQNVLNISKVQIATLQTIQCICGMISPPVCGAIADYIDNQRLVHIVTFLSGTALLTLFQFVDSFTMAAALILVGSFVYAAGGALLDTSVLYLLSKEGGEYGKQRMFGAVGYGVFAYVTGGMVALWGIEWSFYNLFILSFLSVVFLNRMPAPKKSDNPKKQETSALLETGEQEEEHTPTLAEGLKTLLHEPDVLVLFLIVYFMSIMYGVLSSFLALNLYNLSGENPQIVGIAIMCETSSELPAFFYSQKIIDKVGTVNVLLLSCAAYFARVTCYALMPNAWVAIPFEFLHGISFGITWAAVTQYIYERAPPGAEATVMGLLNAVQNGIGRATGTLVGGMLYESFGARTMWTITDMCVPLALCGIAVFARLKSQDEDKHDEEMLEKAALFSPQQSNISAIKSPKFTENESLSYDESK